MAQPRILLVEDEYITALELQGRFEEWGYEVAGRASIGEKAILLARELDPDLVVMDILLKGEMDGVETAEQIRAERDVPIVYVTAYADDRTLQRAKITDPYGYVLKPFEERELRIVIEMALYKAATERELRRYREHLEELVAARTAELSRSNAQLHQEIVKREGIERELRQAKDAADSANRMKSEFLANMSHEFRTPLNGILGYAQILRDHRDLTPRQQTGLDIIEHNGTHLLTILNDLLELSIPEQRVADVCPIAFSLVAFCQELIRFTHLQAQEKGLEFMFEIAPDVPHDVHGDTRRLRQVLLNLLGNALKFTERGRVTLRMANGQRRGANMEADAEDKRRAEDSFAPCLVRFEIEDTGIGIPEEDIERIFEPFERIKNPNLYTEGAGVGLSISRRLVRQMGGELCVSSTVGQGSCFWFELSLPVDSLQPGVPPSEADLSRFASGASVVIPDQKTGMRVPIPEHLKKLYDLALDGDIMGIRACLEKLEEQEPQHQVFIDTVRHFADTWKVSAIQTLLESYLSSASQP